MDRSDVITLLASSKEQDEYGVWRETYTENTVYCEVESVSANEFYEGGRNGLNPEYRITMFFGDYNGERLLQYDGETYSIYRTYRRRGDFIELYVERKGGSNGRS